MTLTAVEKLQAKWAEGKFVCVGLDSDLAKLPEHLINKPSHGLWIPTPVGMDEQVAFNTEIVDATGDIVAAYKPNLAFYLSYGVDGIEALLETVTYIQATFPDVLVILDAKFGDIGNTNLGYIQFAFDYIGADALTIHSYMGQVANQPFLDNPDKLIFVLCRTSNEGANEFQDLYLHDRDNTETVYTEVAFNVSGEWNQHNNCGLVVGATTPDEIGDVRRYARDLPLLIPGIGAQGGELEASVRNASTLDGGFVINSSRGIIFASNGLDFAEAARAEAQKLSSEIQTVRNQIGL